MYEQRSPSRRDCAVRCGWEARDFLPGSHAVECGGGGDTGVLVTKSRMPLVVSGFC
ncbi:hypothetical protein ANO14919_114530 [Xylariales sp. No.14919]|nr:hypothetical protein ANO14919_114530 [Xylariales sp. No.14919]